MGKSLEGKVAVVTGSGQGIGKGIAVFLAKEGAKVVTNNRKPLDRKKLEKEGEGLSPERRKQLLAMRGDAQTAADEIRAFGGEATPFFGDVSDFGTAEKMIRTAVDTYGRIDILVNNAAGLGEGNVAETSEEDWDYMTQAKMKGAFNTMHFAVPYMKKQGFGRILNCASGAWTGVSGLCAYSAGNSGVVGLSKSAAKELFASGITVNVYCPQALSPGHIVEFDKTIKMLEKEAGGAPVIDGEKMEKVEAEHGDPENIGPFIAYLCTEDASFISGSVFSVTGAGRIDLYSEPRLARKIRKDGSPWTVDELKETVPRTLLDGYVSEAAGNDWGAEKKDGIPAGIFPRGKERDGFHGKAFLNMFLPFDHASRCSVGNVSFGPGAHNDWHIHYGYQVLMVTAGEGYCQEWGKPAKRLKAGDVLVLEPGVKHWHGAVEDQGFVHIGMILDEKKPTDGLEAVTEEQYAQAAREAQPYRNPEN